jgi:RNA polymerase sigma-70 factor (ECF subfamily)
VDGIASEGTLDEFHLLHATRADLLFRLGSVDAAAKSYARAVALSGNDGERRFLTRRLRELGHEVSLRTRSP